MSEKQFNLKDPIHLLAVGFGSGLIKPAPGTWGTLAAVPFYIALAQLPPTAYATVVAITAIIGIYGYALCRSIGIDSKIRRIT